MRQVRFNILSFEKSGDKAMATILGGQVEVDMMPDDLNKEDYQILEILTPTDNPAVFDAEYRFVKSYKCPQCKELITHDEVFCKRECYDAFVSIL